jgi:hypothetical protein
VAARADHGPAVRGTRHGRLLLPVDVGWKVGSRSVLSRDATLLVHRVGIDRLVRGQAPRLVTCPLAAG